MKKADCGVWIAAPIYLYVFFTFIVYLSELCLSGRKILSISFIFQILQSHHALVLDVRKFFRRVYNSSSISYSYFFFLWREREREKSSSILTLKYCFWHSESSYSCFFFQINSKNKIAMIIQQSISHKYRSKLWNNISKNKTTTFTLH